MEQRLAQSVKLQIEVVNGRLRRLVEAFVRGKGLPCLHVRVGSVTKALQPPLDVLSRSAVLLVYLRLAIAFERALFPVSP